MVKFNKFFLILSGIGILFFLFFNFYPPKNYVIDLKNNKNDKVNIDLLKNNSPENVINSSSLENETTVVTNTKKENIQNNVLADLPNQARLLNPPKIIKGLYATGWSAGSGQKLNYLISIIKKHNLNAIVIDIKDYSGYLSYALPSEKASQSGALNQIRILYPNKIIKKLHDENIYVIGRITVFQDPIFAKSFSSEAIKNKTTGELWKDNKGLSWIDPKSKLYWDYILEISRDAWNRGFDELNFDYIRFPSDGSLSTMSFPFWDGKTPKNEVIREFFSYLKNNLKDAKISADIFGLTTIALDDLGIGQIISDAYTYFDAVCPMVYPSHFASGVFGYKNPAEHPYEIIKSSMSEALRRLETQTSSSAVLRPWLQAFDLGAKYDKKMINLQVQALEEVFDQKNKYFGGYLFWDPKNDYLSL
jgi:hypothetical protein